jgi:hypothetical protein
LHFGAPVDYRREMPRALSASVVVLALALVPAAAPAATKFEVQTETVSRDATFDGVGCAAAAPQTLALPQGAYDVQVLTPRQGEQLISSVGGPTAVVQSVAPVAGALAWTVMGSGEACAPGREQNVWTTRPVTLRAQVKVRRQVLTRGTVIVRGDRICRGAAREMERVGRRIGTLDDVAAVGRAMSGMARVFRGMHRRLGRLAVPNERRASFDGFLRAVDRMQERADAAAEAARDDDLTALERHSKGIIVAADLGIGHARRYGFRSCAE